MAIYRGRRRVVGTRTGIALALCAALAGALVWATRREPTPDGPAGSDPVQALIGVLEILPISYESAVRNGALISGQAAQYRGAQDALRRAQALFNEAREPIAARDPATARLIGEALQKIQDAVAGLRPPIEVRGLTDRVIQALKDLRDERKSRT